MDHLIRLVQTHEPFRLAEIRALASTSSIDFKIIFYRPDSPFLVLRVVSYPTSRYKSAGEAVAAMVARSVLAMAVYVLWGGSGVEGVGEVGGEREREREGKDESSSIYAALHDDVRSRTGGDRSTWELYGDCSFKFSLDSYGAKRSPAEQVDIINSFNYLGFRGPIQMRNPDVEFTVFEEWGLEGSAHHQPKDVDGLPPSSPDDVTPVTRYPHRIFFGRLLGPSARATLTQKHSLKTRLYISTTSMDATLALVTANIAQAGPGKVICDPFVGTGGFLVAAAEFGAQVWGSDIDGRSFRGTGGGGKPSAAGSKGCAAGIEKNFKAYGLQSCFGDCFISDITHSPLRCRSLLPRSGAPAGFLDAIVCDPPYGVREGLKVLGSRGPRSDSLPLMIDGVPAHTLPGYIAPKKQYSFERLLDDILEFAAETLVVNGRLAFWTPSAGLSEDDDHEAGGGCTGGDGHETLKVPSHSALELTECCVQDFRNWSRRLLVYRRREVEVEEPSSSGKLKHSNEENGELAEAKTASDLNPFRRKYFQGFQT